MKTILIPCLLFFAAPVLAAPAPPMPPSAYQIIQKEGRLVFTDGSSYYDFEKDGTFHSGPWDMSGRTIDGQWKRQNSTDDFSPLIVQGTWSWMNGISQINDKRQMTIAVYPKISQQPNEAEDTTILAPIGSAPRRAKLRPCYFVIDELVALPKSK